jgi:hypothetical protein
MADVPQRVNMQGVHYVLREIAPGPLVAYNHLTTGYNLYHEEDRDGAGSLSANYTQQLARSNSVLVKTHMIPETPSWRLNVNSLGNQATYPTLPQARSSYNPLSTRNADQTMRAPKWEKDLVSETSTDNSDQERSLSHKASRGHEGTRINRKETGKRKPRSGGADSQPSRSSLLEPTSHPRSGPGRNKQYWEGDDVEKLFSGESIPTPNDTDDTAALPLPPKHSPPPETRVREGLRRCPRRS